MSSGELKTNMNHSTNCDRVGSFVVDPEESFKLFCLPYAGGSASVYRNWIERLRRIADVRPVEIPGRGVRRRETPFVDLRELARVLTQELTSDLEGAFAIFGHSMGATLGFEIALELRRRGRTAPTALFVSAARAPHLEASSPDYWIHNLPTDKLLERLRALNSTATELLDHEELMDLLLPHIRADFRAIETYTYIQEAPLDIPIFVFGGAQDKQVSTAQLAEWRQHTASDFSVGLCSGEHLFFLKDSSELLMRLRFAIHDMKRVRHGIRTCA